MRAGTQRAGIVALMAAALTMGLTFAHTLELPQKLGYGAVTWTRVQQSLYRYSGVVGGPLEAAAAIAAVVFSVRSRGRSRSVGSGTRFGEDRQVGDSRVFGGGAVPCSSDVVASLGLGAAMGAMDAACAITFVSGDRGAKSRGGADRMPYVHWRGGGGW